jgi:RimJ/RimL family protein N-acetyltransferase
MADAPGTYPGLLRPRYPVRSERLLLRPLARSDADALLAYRSRADVSRYVPFEPMSRDDILERIAGQWARAELTDEGQALTLGAEVAATGELAGDVMLAWHSREHAGGEVARIDEDNEPSLRLARRLGMRQEARLVRNEFFKGRWSNEVDFAMLADEWFARRSQGAVVSGHR